MTGRADGGPAFPGGTLPPHPHTPNGMTLRDWFAGMAAQGMLAHYGNNGHEALALLAYGAADALIAARKESQK